MRKFVVFAAILLVFFILNCQKEPVQSGEALARQYCISCHQFPSPEALDKNTWQNHVLPRMGYFFGIYDDANSRASLIGSGTGATIVENANIFPKVPSLDAASWQKIQKYFLDNAPDELPLPQNWKIAEKTDRFLVKKPAFKRSPPSTTLVQFSRFNDHVFFGDANSKAFYQLDHNLEIINVAQVKEGAVSLIESEQALIITVMGSFSPTDNPDGFLLYLPKDKQKKPIVLINNLQRPVHTAFADFNGDRLDDFVIAEFGKWTGGLSIWFNNGNGTFRKQLLRAQPGAIKSEIRDFNNDGLLDVLALFGQGEEGFYLFQNKKDGNFETKKILSFPPTYGSSSFEWSDFNQDGLDDIVYTAGDNADYPAIRKPYHGIYVFLNEGSNQFKDQQDFFFPLYGAYAAKAKDFDLDGDIDIAALSFFPDFQNNPEQAFVYLENSGDFSFNAASFPEVNSSRWMVMNMGDPDQDGDPDLVLGGLTLEVVPDNGMVNKWVDQGLPFLILENLTK